MLPLRRHSVLNILLLLGLALSPVFPAATPAVLADHTPPPTSVAVVGSLQSELGCPDDWQPACESTWLTEDAADDVWQGTWEVPAGSWEYKAALSGTWDENYGANAAANGSNLPLNVEAARSVKFYYDHKSHWITSNANAVIATVPGSFQSELGCPGDWDAGCLRSWLQDPDGDGTYAFETTGLPAGSYEAKVAINESWDENYGAGGAQNGANIPFTVPASPSRVSFTYDPATHVLTIAVTPLGGAQPDNNVEWDGLRHDSRDSLYRAPGGAVAAGTPVHVRFRTFHNDVTAVSLRLYSLEANGQTILPLSVAASDVSCYQPGLESKTCDFWQVTLPNSTPDNVWYRFIVTDGADTDYYADNTAALDGGLGAASDDAVDFSYALTVYDPAFSAPGWAQTAVIYQIFPDRFRNAQRASDPKTGDVRYDDPVLFLPWGTLPEGFCRNYGDAADNCPWRFDETPPDWSPTKEGPRGRDYFGGDLLGVTRKLGYLKTLGVTAIYFNPIFDAGSNHGYDTQDYYKIDPYFGTQREWDTLVRDAKKFGIRIILDGVFNHVSSDSPFFDRYQHYSEVGACESLDSPYRSWFYFHDVPAGTGACAGSAGPNSANYDSWFGFDSIPVLNKSNPQVQAYFLTGPESVSQYWLNRGAAGWRLDVMGDASFPDGYWETFRGGVKATDPNALIIGELWQKDSTLLRFLRGDRADTTMNYRLRDAVLGLLAPTTFDSKGFGDSGRVIEPSEFAARLASVREDYPDAAYYALMNLLDGHDTERLLWTLTPGPETRAGREFDAGNLAEGKQRLRLASLIQFTVPGAPTVYYGDEVGLTGDDDPDDRRTYPWEDGEGDLSLLSHYQSLTAVRRNTAALTAGDFRILLADDTAGTVAYGRRTTSQAAIVAINRSAAEQLLTIPVAGYVPDGFAFTGHYGVGNPTGTSVLVAGGQLQVTLAPLSGLLLTTGEVDLAPPGAPTGLSASEGSHQVALAWNAVPGAAGYNVYRSPLSGGGWVRVNDSPLAGPSFIDTGLPNGRAVFYIVRALDAAGNESAASAEVSAMPHDVIGWANIQWPPELVHTISAVNRTAAVYGQVWIDGVTSQPGPAPALRAQLGFGPDGSHPAGHAGWTWVEATFNVDAGNNDEFVASLLPEQVGTFDYAYRYSTTGGRDWIYADLSGINYDPARAGSLTVLPSGDNTAPAVPAGLHVVAASPGGIELAWSPVEGDASLYGYEVRRSLASGGEYTTLALVTGTSYLDAAVTAGGTYYYVVRAVDTSFNRSGHSAEVSATAALRTVTVTFTVEVPATTDATGRPVYIAGTLNRLDGGLPEWNPGGVVLTRVDATHWTISLTGQEATQIEYKYALGSWDYVEKDGSCGEIGNRLLTLSYGAGGTQAVNDTVANWRNVAPCGN